MPVFISYSHNDKDFVDRLAANIVKNRGSVWVDRWELNVGDSILRKVQDAITNASALLVVLSKASVESEWFKKELSAGLMRELDEKRVVVLPVLLEDCAIPAFLREKMYADFRTDFDAGLKAVLEGIAAVTNVNQSRLENGEYTADWAGDWWFDEGLFHVRYTIVETSKTLPVTVLTEILVSCNESATRRYNQYAAAGLDFIGRGLVAQVLFEIGEREEFHLTLDNQFPESFKVGFGDPKLPIRYDMSITSRKLGADTGKLHVVSISGYLRNIKSYVRDATRKLTDEETRAMVDILRSPIE